MARFPRRARLLKPGEFQAALKRGKRHNDRWLTAACVVNDLGHPRLGVRALNRSLRVQVRPGAARGHGRGEGRRRRGHG